MIRLTVPEIGQEELEEIKDVFDSKYLVQGEKVEVFERLVADYLNVKHVIAVSNGTAALHLSALALDLNYGNEVIIPDFTFPATSNIVEIAGAVSKFVDIDIESLCINTDSIEREINERTKLIIPVHEFGQSADMDKIMSIAKKYNLKVIEDAACALGTEYKGRKVGTIGDIGCFSFHPRKAITTGEGGVVVTNSDKIAEKIRILRNHGLTYANGKPEFVYAGYNYRLTNLQGAIGIAQMKRLKQIIEKRKEIAKMYNNLLKDNMKLTIPSEKGYGTHVYQTYHVILNENIDRDMVISKLKYDNIETNIGAYAVHRQPYYVNKYNYSDNYFKNSILAHSKGLALPLHSQLDFSHVEYIVNKLLTIIGE